MTEALRSGWIAQGPRVRAFEDAVCRVVGDGEGVAVSSGTAALYLALHALGIGPGDEVIVSTYSCSALLNAVYFCGAAPVVADVLREEYTIDPDDVQRRLTPRTRAIVAVHIFGIPARVADLMKYGVPVIEDSAQALGSRHGERHVGLAGAAAIFSFYASKVITTGYGGMVTSANADLVARLRDYREFDCQPTYAQRFNFQLSDIQAALGLSQLRRLDAMLARRRDIQAAYRRALPPSARIPPVPGTSEPNGFRFVLEFPGPAARDAARQAFLEAGIETINPIERFELLHRYLHYPPEAYRAAEAIVDHTLSLPTFPTMSDEDVDRVSTVLARLG